MPNPAGLQAGIENIAQTNNGYVIASWPSNPADDNVVAYEIQWRDTANSNYQTVRTTETSFTFHKLYPGHTYGFSIQAINNLGAPSGFSSERTITVPTDASAPAAPSGLTAYKSPRGALLFWNGNSEADLAGYQLEWGVPLASGLTSGVAITSIPLAAPLTTGIANGATVSVESDTFTTSGAVAAGATSIPVVSKAPTVNHSANAPVWCGQLVFPAASLATSAAFMAPSGTVTGTTLNFRLRAVDWTGNVSAWTTAAAAATTDGVVIDELLVGNLKVAMTLTAGSIQTAAGGARTVMDSTSFRAYDGSATNWGAPSGAGVTFEADHSGNVFVKGTVASSIVQSAVFIGSGSAPVYSAPSTGFSIDPTNGFRWWSAGTLQAQWAANGALTIYSGATITASTMQTASNLGVVGGSSGFKLSGHLLQIFSQSTGAGGTQAYISFLTSNGSGFAAVESAQIKVWEASLNAGSGQIMIAGSSSVILQAGLSGTVPNLSVDTSNIRLNAGLGAGALFTSGLSHLFDPTPTGPGQNGSRAHTIPILIAEVVPNANTASITFSNIPQGFRHLELRIATRSDTASSFAEVDIAFNGDRTASYDTEMFRGSGTSTTQAGETFNAGQGTIGHVAGAGSSTSTWDQITVEIHHYTDTTHSKTYYSRNTLKTAQASGGMYDETWAGYYHDGTPAITSIAILNANGNFLAGSVFTLIGIP